MILVIHLLFFKKVPIPNIELQIIPNNPNNLLKIQLNYWCGTGSPIISMDSLGHLFQFNYSLVILLDILCIDSFLSPRTEPGV